MIINVATDAAFDALDLRVKAMTESLLEGLPVVERGALIPKEGHAKDSVFSLNGDEWLFLLRDGNVAATLGGNVVFFYEPGELIGFEAAFGTRICELKNEFAVRVDVYDKEVVQKKIRKDEARFAALMEYMATLSGLYQVLLGSSLAATRRPNFQIKRYAEGSVIIKEGDTDTDVYSMINGEAGVWVRGVRVGTIRADEVFGEMSRLTGAPRSASVIAEGECEVMVFGGDDFAELADTNPAALHDIARNLSERLAKLNHEVAPAG